MAQAAAAPPSGEDWRNKLNLPAKDTRVRTEVGAGAEQAQRGRIVAEMSGQRNIGSSRSAGRRT